MSPQSDEPPLVYVYIGDVLPDYVAPSLQLTRRLFRGPMIVLTNAENALSVPGVAVEDFSGWYSDKPFSTFRDKSSLDSVFRGGFWLATAERFFVLSQYMEKANLQSLFHAELDNIVFNLDGLSEDLDSLGEGIFYPTDQLGTGCGSLVYCNKKSGIDSLVQFMAQNTDLGDEMAILGAFVRAHPEVAFPLPSAAAIVDNAGRGFPRGMFDAMSIGLWLFGIDPANTVYSTFTKEPHAHSKDPVREMTFSLKARRGYALASLKGHKPFRVHNLHIHSKILRRLNRRGAISLYFLAHRLPWRIPVVIQPGHWRHRFLKLLINQSRRAPLHRLLRTEIGHTALRFLVSSSRVPLSNRQLQILQTLLPTAMASDDSSMATVIINSEQDGQAASVGISCSLWHKRVLASGPNDIESTPADENHLFTTPLQALEYLLALEIDAAVLTEGSLAQDDSLGVASSLGKFLCPDMAKPHWEPHFELPIFPYRSRAVTFTTTPQAVSLVWLREIFPTDSIARRWAKQVRPDTFLAALINVYCQHVIVKRRSFVQLAVRNSDFGEGDDRQM